MRTYGRSSVVCHHPNMDDEYCLLDVKWHHYYSQPSLEEPGDDDYELDNITLISVCDERVAKDTPVPDWVTNEMIWDGVDMFDYYDGHNEN